MRTAAAAVIAALLAGPASARAEPPVTLRALFPNEADVFVERPGIVRLALPVEVIGACRPDLSDVRIVDPAGREVPFLVDSGPRAGRGVELVHRFAPALLEVNRDEARRDDGPPLHRERYEIASPGPAPVGETWQLRVHSDHGAFVRRVSVASVLESGEVVTILERESIFRIVTAGGRLEEKATVELLEVPAGRLVVTLEGEDGFYLEPRFELARRRGIGALDEVEVPLSEASRSHEGGRTIVELDRPAGIVAAALRLRTTTSLFRRPVSVEDERRGTGRTPLGAATLFRLRDLAGVEWVEIALRPASGERLRVEIHDGDSPPLEELSFVAVVRRPSLIFSAGAPAGDGPVATFLFGGGRAHAPEYDVAGLLPGPGHAAHGERAVAAARLYEAARSAPARLGPVRDNPAFDDRPALAFAMRSGAEVDPRLYSHRRALALRPSGDGVARVRLGLEELAVAREDLADVRIVDRAWRQWPYLLAPEEVRESVPLAIGEHAQERRASRYRLKLPSVPLRLDGVVVEPQAAFVNRPYRLEARLAAPRAPEVSVLSSGRIVQPAPRRGSPRIGFAPVRVTSLELVVENGGDAPLAFREVRAAVPLPELFVTAPAGEYWLLVGNPDDSAPAYELEAVRPVVFAVASASVPPAALDANPVYSVRARLGTGGTVEVGLFWTLLVAAVVVLGTITLRLARPSVAPKPD